MLHGHFWTLEREHLKTSGGQQGANKMSNGRPKCARSCDLTISKRTHKLVDVFSYAHEVLGYTPHLRRHGMVRWVHEHNIGASLASPRVSQSSLYLFPDHCPSCGRLGSEGMLGATSSLGYATGQDDEPPDSSPQQRVGCTSADQSLDMRILASLYRTMIFPVALLSSVVDALQVTYRNTIRQAEKERERDATVS